MSKKLSILIIIIFGTISLLLIALIYVAGTDESLIADPLLIWIYALLAFAIGITVVFTLLSMVKTMLANHKAAIKILIPIIVFITIFVTGWLLGSGDKITILGYGGTQNIGFWAHFADMMLYAIYAIFILIGLVIVG
ncbi:MAG: hypothetical protein LBV75_01820, partial [Paludibacter sp.]|nr:hypothetical protein [Paludibacter sp.]